MPRNKALSQETVAIIEAITKATASAQIVADEVERELRKHTDQDDKRFEALTVLVESIAKDVKSLINSRQFFRGAWWAIVGMAGLAGTGLAAIWHYFELMLFNYSLLVSWQLPPVFS